ncbi:acyltransferase family protein [Actinoplanes sp. CA-051413]|uniref:acyltransferase family protein n=1 Tax=Actinoplanes sp. CA-051413 TaxID=3239899 RepID=UPI003D9831BC
MRNRYLDLLRAAAIVRVIVYHLFGWPWLSILLPAMGIMFALAGSLTAASLDRRSAGSVITSRLRRLLPPLWLLAVIAVPAMLYLGWTDEDGGDEPLSWKLGLWLLPIGDPPGSEKGIDVWEPLWYIRAYLWFVVLSPLLYLAYKKIGWAAVAAPIVLIAVLDKTDFSLPFGRADAAMWDFATYGACWIAGFAHHDGRLARIRPGLVVAASAVMGLAALYWLRGHASESGWDLNEVSESQALWSLAFVLLALRWQPDMSWLERRPRVDGAVNLLNARAVTIYLWHNIAIAAIWPVLTVLALDDLGELDGPTDLVASLGLTLLAVVAFGWVEDLAARRRPRLWPVGGGRRGAAGGGLGSGAGAGLASSSEVASGSGSGAGLGSRSGSGSQERPGSGLGSGSGSGLASSSELATGSGLEAGSRSGSGLEPGSRTESGLDQRSRSELGSGSGLRSESGLESGSGLESEFGLGSGYGSVVSDSEFASQPTGDLSMPGQAGSGLSVTRPASGFGGGEVPWGSAGAAPVVVGDAGFGSRRRESVAEFPEAEVSFGLPEVGRGFGDREEIADAGRHAAVSSAIAPPRSPSPPPSVARPTPPGTDLTSPGASPTSPVAGPTPPGPSAAGPSAPAQARRHGDDDHAPAGSWFGGEHDEPK